MKKSYWLFKSEPDAYSLQDLEKEPKKTAFWDGIRNYQARNLLRDTIQIGDEILFYHSRIAKPAVVGTSIVVSEAYPDPTAMDSKSNYYDPKQTLEKPIWYGVDIQYVSRFSHQLNRDDLKKIKGLENMMVLRRGMRLSIQPVTTTEWRLIVKAGKPEPQNG
jgi:predicted RNA-binding protein with PUA-like domain